MGMESFSVLAISKDVENIKENGIWGLRGRSVIAISNIDIQLERMGAVLISKRRWLFDNCIEITEYEDGGFFQGIEFKGCLSWLNEGVEIVFKFLQSLLEILSDLDVFVLGQKAQAKTSKELYAVLVERYKDKITIFERQYGKIQLKATCGAFYKEMEKREKWYYKLFHRH